MGHEADRTKTIHSVNHPAVPYSYGIIAIAECLEKQCSDVSRTFLEKAVRPVFTNGRLIICVLDKASSLNDFPNDPKAFDLPLSCFLVLYVLHPVDVVVPLDFLDHRAAGLHFADIFRDSV